MSLQARPIEPPQSDVFLPYNAREAKVEQVVTEIRHRGLSIFYDRADVPQGFDATLVRNDQFEYSRAVLLVIRAAGWGPIQRDIAQRAMSSGMPILPALIGVLGMMLTLRLRGCVIGRTGSTPARLMTGPSSV